MGLGCGGVTGFVEDQRGHGLGTPGRDGVSCSVRHRAGLRERERCLSRAADPAERSAANEPNDRRLTVGEHLVTRGEGWDT